MVIFQQLFVRLKQWQGSKLNVRKLVAQKPPFLRGRGPASKFLR